jgi:beta-galactosidase
LKVRKIEWNENWTVRCLTREKEPVTVTVPHDAMIDEPRSSESAGEGNIGWYIGGDYEYVKHFAAPLEWQGQTAMLEFEGVYHNAEVYLNGEKAAFRPYGYTNFYVDLNPFLKYGEENELKVIARNSDQPNSRWYSGTGIYRPVILWLGGEEHIPVNGVKIRTIDYLKGKIEVHVRLSRPGNVTVEILDGEQSVAERSYQSSSTKVRFPFTIHDAKLWDTEHPNLYKARVTFGEDVVEETFGIRSLSWSAKEGITINGKRVILRGACIHHDNGLLGACAFPEAEERKVRLHK